MAPVVWLKNRGRDGWNSPLEVDLDRSVESVNISLYNGGLGTKRAGSTAMTISELDYVGHNALIEHTPGPGGDLVAILFVVDQSATTKILYTPTGGTNNPTWQNLTLKDNVSSLPWDVNGVTLNNKLYLAYDSLVNRLHVYDADTSSTSVRRGGLAPFASAATAGDTGAGAYAATLRYYTTRSVEVRSGLVIRRSETNASVAFTPNGVSASVRITQPTPVNEGETDWEIYGSTDNLTFYGPLATVAIGTPTYDDSSTPSTWASTYEAEPVAGFHTPFPSVKYLGTDGTRLYGLGVYEDSAGDSLAPKAGRFYFGPVQDSSATHDDERISNTTTIEGWIDLARNSGSLDRGVTKKPVNNLIYAFQSRGIYALSATGDATAPYRRIVASSALGAVNHQSIVIAIDRTDKDCIYFLDPVIGPCVIGGADGVKWCGKDVKDIWDGFNREATTLPAWGLWFPDRSQVIFAIATGSNNDPDTMLVLDPTEQYLDEKGSLRGGWTVWTGDFADARCGIMFSDTFSSPRSPVKVPYVGLNSGTVMLRYDESATADDATTFQAYVTSGALVQGVNDLEVQRTYLAASAENGVTIQASFTRNFGDETNRTSEVILTPDQAETTVLRKFEDAQVQEAWALQVTLGDSEAVSNGWQIHQWHSEIISGGPR